MATEVMSMNAARFESLAWVHDNPTTLACRPKVLSADTAFRGRRSHKKSRLGCGNCKRRRVKCDETKPKCEKCVQQRIACDYLKPCTLPDAEGESSPESPWSSATTASLSSDLVEAQLRSVISPEKNDSLAIGSSARNTGSSLIEVLNHFKYKAWRTIGTPKIQQTMRTKVLSMAQDSPFLMNAILAFSARHLHTLRPEGKKHRTMAIYHSQLALQLCSQELNGKLTLPKVNSMIAACLLVSAIVFFTEDSRSSASFVFSDDPKASDWLLMVTGLSLLVNRFEAKEFVSQSFWLPIFTGTPECMFPPLPSGKIGIPEPFVKLCHIDENSTADNNPYHGELQLLTHMMTMEVNKESAAKIIQFPCRMNPAFNVLIREKDPVALLILAYWFAKTLEVDFWWLGTRARSELFAICSYLDGWPDERFQPLLQYPMKACGYVPIDLDLIETWVFGM